MKQTVLLPFIVPVGNFCWDVSNHEICEHLDNYGGYAQCTMGFHIPYECRDKQGNVVKPPECRNLKVQETQ